MVRKTNKEHKDVSVQITRFKNEKSRCDRSDFLKSQKKKPSMPLDHLKDKEMLKNRRLQKRNVKRENQRRKDVSLAAAHHIEKCIDSLQNMNVEPSK